MYLPEEIKIIWMSCSSWEEWDTVFEAFNSVIIDDNNCKSFNEDSLQAFDFYGNLSLEKLMKTL